MLWSRETYPKWTIPFCEGGSVVTDWKEGSKVQFLTPGGVGMYGKIEKNVANRFMSFKHIGEVKDNKEMPLDEKTKTWTGAMENYMLEQKGDSTKLTVELDTTDENQDFFQGTFEKALDLVKELSEEKS